MFWNILVVLCYLIYGKGIPVFYCIYVYFLFVGNTCDLWLLQGFVLFSSCAIKTYCKLTARVSRP